MIKIKFGEQGGYVVGDGPCPFDADEFMAAFMGKIVEAKRAGLTEIGFTDEEVDEMKQQQLDAFAALPVVEVIQSKRAATSKSRIFSALSLENVQL
jgi:hypothetical protein